MQFLVTEPVRRMRITGAVSICVVALLAAISHATPQAGRERVWWSLAPVKNPAPPRLHDEASGSRNPIDAFVLSKLLARRIRPVPLADRRTLIRRIYFDVIGLPPSPEAVESFIRDRDPGAYEKLVDRLLANPGYGERWARHWLDVVRFGESQGFERDHLRANSWPYRDYVIKAFNDDKPYDRFILDQIAGDALKDADSETIAATGFLVAGPWDEVGHTSTSPAVKVRARDEELEDMVGVVSQTFLGVTANCARCHDHKFDPIPQRDYYRLRAVFEGATPGDRVRESEGEKLTRLSQVEAVQKEIDSYRRASDSLIEAGFARVHPGTRLPSNVGPRIVPLFSWSFRPDDTRAGQPAMKVIGGARMTGDALTLTGSGSYAASDPLHVEVRSKTLEAWVTLDNLTQRGGAALTIQTPDGAQFDAITFGERQPRKWGAGSEGFRRTNELSGPEESVVGKPIHVAVTHEASGRITVYRNGIRYGESYVPPGESATAPIYRAGKSQALIGLRHSGSNGFLVGSVDEARIYDRALGPDEVLESYRRGTSGIDLRVVRAALTAAELEALNRSEKALSAASDQLSRMRAEPLVYAIRPITPPATFVLQRGDPDSRGEQVAAGALTCCQSSGEIGAGRDASESERRLALAKWIADRRNPLTARVMVNRIWQHHFGRPLVGTPNDFGGAGEKPTHPELLDWLASRLMGGGWKLKPLHRMILLSAAYRRSSRHDIRAAKLDADNSLFWRYSPQRLDGETARDAILAVSGRLNPKQGGPSFRPFTVRVDNSSFYTLIENDDPELDRRTVYRMNIQGARMPLLDVLDCPDPSTKTPRRNVTTTPLQALEFMNSRFTTRQSEWFAARIEREAGNALEKKVDRAFRLAYCRPPTAVEQTDAVALVKRNGLRGLTWAIINSSEFLYAR